MFNVKLDGVEPNYSSVEIQQRGRIYIMITAFHSRLMRAPSSNELKYVNQDGSPYGNNCLSYHTSQTLIVSSAKVTRNSSGFLLTHIDPYIWRIINEMFLVY
jgi:hypothetical protein